MGAFERRGCVGTFAGGYGLRIKISSIHVKVAWSMVSAFMVLDLFA